MLSSPHSLVNLTYESSNDFKFYSYFILVNRLKADLICVTFNWIFHVLLLKCHLSLFHNVFILVEPIFEL